MWKALCAAALVIGLSACQTYKLERGKPVKLTSDELRDVEESVAWDLRQSLVVRSESPDSVKFGRIAAARDSKGMTFLCGYVRLKESDGSYSDEMLFNGILADYPSRLHNDRVLTSAVARNAEGNAFMRSRCQMFGVEI